MAFDWLSTNEKTEERRWLHGHQGVITWTRPKLEEFEKAYANAVEYNKAEFKFDGFDFLTPYAGYLKGYLDKVLI